MASLWCKFWNVLRSVRILHPWSFPRVFFTKLISKTPHFHNTDFSFTIHKINTKSTASSSFISLISKYFTVTITQHSTLQQNYDKGKYDRSIGVFPKWIRNSVNSANSGNLINHWSTNWAQFIDPDSHLCLAGTMIASWSLTEEVAGSSPFNDK